MALTAGLTHAEFWGLSMRELGQRLAAYGRRQRTEHEGRLFVAALQTAELVNVVGALGAGEKWKPITPRRYFDAWTGGSQDAPQTADEVAERIARVEAGIREREQRRRAQKAAGTQTETR